MSASAVPVPVPWIVMVVVPIFGLFFGLLSVSDLLVEENKKSEE